MRFLMKAPKNLSEAGMRGYLYRTADSLIIDQWRRSKREHARDVEAAEQPPPPVDPDFSNDMNRAFRQLKPEQRSLLWMAYVEELDHREIALSTEKREQSVRVLLFRARKAFARILERAGFGPEAADAK